MRINEVITEGRFDKTKAVLGKGASLLGKGVSFGADALAGSSLNPFASQQQNIANKVASTYSNDLNVARRAAERAGLPFDAKKYVTGVVKKYGFDIADYTNELNDIITTLDSGKFDNTSVKKYANLMQLIGSQQARDSSGRVISGGSTSIDNTTATPASNQISSSTKQIIGQLKQYTGSANANDLNQIALVALNKLYKINKTDYASLVKQLMSGSTKQTPQATTP